MAFHIKILNQNGNGHQHKAGPAISDVSFVTKMNGAHHHVSDKAGKNQQAVKIGMAENVVPKTANIRNGFTIYIYILHEAPFIDKAALI